MHFLYLQNINISILSDHGHTSYWEPGNTEDDLYREMFKRQYRKISLADIHSEYQVGEGEFGIVYKGEWTSTKGKTRTVALKTLKSTASNDEKVKLLQEAAIMGQFSHPHIVKLYGVVKESETVRHTCMWTIHLYPHNMYIYIQLYIRCKVHSLKWCLCM